MRHGRLKRSGLRPRLEAPDTRHKDELASSPPHTMRDWLQVARGLGYHPHDDISRGSPKGIVIDLCTAETYPAPRRKWTELAVSSF